MKKAVFALAVLIPFVAGCSSTTSDSQPPVQQETKHGADESFSGSLDSLMEKGFPMKCTWSYEDSQGSAEGTVWVSGGKYRTDVSISSGDMYAMRDGTYMYTWGDMMPKASKIKLSVMKDMAKSLLKRSLSRRLTSLMNTSAGHGFL